MKKICFYFNSMNMSGGVERVITNLINNLSDYYEITVLVKDDKVTFYEIDESVKIDSIYNFLDFDMGNKYKRIYNVLSNTLTSIVKLRGYFKHNNFDYVYTATPLDSFQVYFSLNPKEKLVVSEHASRDAYNFIYRIMRSYVYKKVKVISVPTKLDTRRYIEDGYNAIYIPHLTTFRSHDCQNKKKPIVLNIGRLTNDKQQILLLDIWKKYIDRNPKSEWILEIVGEGELRNDLEKKILDYQLEDHAFLRGATHNVSEYYEQSSIFAFTSKMEGYGMVLTEAMSYGVACISFDCPSGPADIISDNIDGFLVDCFDVDSYVDKLEELINDASLRRKFYKSSIEKIDQWDNGNIILQWREKVFF